MPQTAPRPHDRPLRSARDSTSSTGALSELRRAWAQCTEAQRLAFFRTTLADQLPLVEDAMVIRAAWLCDACRDAMEESG